MPNKKPLSHVRLEPEHREWVDRIAAKRGISRSEALNYLIGRMRQRDETYFPRHSAIQSFLASGLALRMLEVFFWFTDPRPDRQAALENARNEAELEMQALMRQATRLFGPAPRVQDPDWAGNDELADATTAALIALYRGLRR